MKTQCLDGAGQAIAPQQPAAWTSEEPKLDGVYLSKFDRFDEDDDAATYHVRGGKTYTPAGDEWICFGGIWKRIGDLLFADKKNASKGGVKD
jgi:hypothetical protein